MMMSWKQLLIGLALACSACGGAGEFGEAHAAEIQADCTQSEICKSHGAAEIENCIGTTTSRLSSYSDSQQQFFLDQVARCASQSSCLYVQCTQSDPTSGWAGQHQDLITYECQQRSLCKMSSGQLDSTSAVNDCISQLSAQTNADPLAQQSFEKKVVNCQGRTGCGWTSCL
jgi:hypothetical protein